MNFIVFFLLIGTLTLVPHNHLSKLNVSGGEVKQAATVEFKVLDVGLTETVSFRLDVKTKYNNDSEENKGNFSDTVTQATFCWRF